MFKSKEYGGLGAVELGSRLHIAFIKNVSAAICRKALWVGDVSMWRKRRGRARQGPDYKLIYGDFISQYQDLQIDWNGLPSKMIFKKINDSKYGGLIKHKYLTDTESTEVIKTLKTKNLSESIRDVRWLISVNRLAVRAVVSWSCYVTTKTCPMIYCNEDETQQHLLMDCYRAQEVWSMLQGLGLAHEVGYKSVMYGLLDEKMSVKQKELSQLIISITCFKLWKTRCVMVLEQTVIDSDTVVKQILTDLRRRRTLDKNQILPWSQLDF